MSTFLHPSTTERAAFKRLAIRQQFKFANNNPSGTWVKVGLNKYAAPATDPSRGKGYKCTNTGKVNYFQGNTFTTSPGTSVQVIYPAIVATEDMMRDW